MAQKLLNYLWTAIFVAVSILSSPAFSALDRDGNEIKEVDKQAEYAGPDEALKGLTENLTEKALAAKSSGSPIEVVGVSEDVMKVKQALAQRAGAFTIVNNKGSGKNTLLEYVAGELTNGKEIYRLDIGALISNTSYHKQLETKLNQLVQAFEAANGSKVLYIENADDIAKDDSVARTLSRVSNKFLILITATQTGYNELKKFPVFTENVIYTKKVDAAHISDVILKLLPEIQNETKMEFSAEAVEKVAELTVRYFSGEPSLIAKAVKILKQSAAREKTEKETGGYEFGRLQDRRGALHRQMEIYKKNISTLENSPLEEDALKVEELNEKLREAKLTLDLVDGQLKEVMEKTPEGAQKTLEAWQAELKRAKASGDMKLASEIENQRIPKAEARVKYFKTDTAHRFNMIDTSHIIRTVSEMTKIPPETLGASPKQLIDKLITELNANFFGQGTALKAVVDAYKVAMSGVEIRTKPQSALLAGSTGVGKTFLVKLIARIMYGSEMNMKYFNFERFNESHSVSELFGAHEGYVGFKEGGGQLIEYVRNNPYALILIDEVEKGHKEVFQSLMGILDNGYYDHKGEIIDFRNVTFMITTNAATEYALYRDVWSLERVAEEYKIDIKELEGKSKDEIGQEILKRELVRMGWADAVINRLMMMIIFNPINEKTALKIATSLLDKQVKEAWETKRIHVSYTPTVVKSMVKAGFDASMGARPFDRVRQKTVLTLLAEVIYQHDPGRGSSIHFDFKQNANGDGGQLEATLKTSKETNKVAMEVVYKAAMSKTGRMMRAMRQMIESKPVESRVDTIIEKGK